MNPNDRMRHGRSPSAITMDDMEHYNLRSSCQVGRNPKKYSAIDHLTAFYAGFTTLTGPSEAKSFAQFLDNTLD